MALEAPLALSAATHDVMEAPAKCTLGFLP